MKKETHQSPETLSAILAEIEKQSPSIVNDWQVVRHVSEMLTMHVLVSKPTLEFLLPVQLAPDSFDGHYFFEITFMKVDKTAFKNLPSFAGVPAHTEMRARTYITYNGLPGYYNLDIYTDDLVAASIMKRAFNFPYRTGRIKHATNYYSFDDAKKKRSLHVTWTPGIETDTAFDNWISGRNFSMQQNNDYLEIQESYSTDVQLNIADIVDFKISFDAESLREEKAHVFHPVIGSSFSTLYGKPLRIEQV